MHFSDPLAIKAFRIDAWSPVIRVPLLGGSLGDVKEPAKAGTPSANGTNPVNLRY